MLEKNQIVIWGCLILLFFGARAEILAQEQTFAFPVTEEGVYKITLNQAQQMGASNLQQIKILGYPGPLPQILSESSFELLEIPTQIIQNELFVYLTGPHTAQFLEGELIYKHHPYTDTLHYLIQVENPLKRVLPIENEGFETYPSLLYRLQFHKNEEFNLLNSGRRWFGDRMGNGERTSLTFQKSHGASRDFYLQVQLMAQSLASNTFTSRLNGIQLAQTDIPPIPNSTYGVKGREALYEQKGLLSEDSESFRFKLDYSTGNSNGYGYLDHLIIGEGFEAADLPQGIYYNLSDLPVNIQAHEELKIWDISDFFEVKELNQNQGHGLMIEKIAVFDPNSVPAVNSIQSINLGLRQQIPSAQLLIVTASSLKSQATRLAQHKQSLGLNTAVVTPEEIYPAFGYGNRDVVAIRNFIAQCRLQNPSLENVLFFGKGTYDFKGLSGGRPNLLPTYASRNSLNPLTTFSSDDFFGFVQLGEGDWEESNEGDHELSLGIGRLPVINLSEAAIVVDKIIQYENLEVFEEDWNKRLLLFADDGDNNIHLNDAETHADYLKSQHPELVVDKLYLDAFEQVTGSSGQTSPEAKAAFTQHIEEGTLLINYIGHGNETTLTAERVFTVADIGDWSPNKKLPLFVTATCEFGRQDSPFLRSGAEELLIVPQKGAIAVLTTGRPVFSSVNFTLNKAFIEAVFKKEEGQYLSLGEIFKQTKNNSLRGVLNRNFSLIGDPSLRLPLPELKMEALEINDLTLEIESDTLKALQQVLIKGAVKDPVTELTVDRFNGSYELTILDKAGEVRTLGDESNPATFKVNDIVLFRGQGTIDKGIFESEAFIPQNINYTFGEGTIRITGIAENQKSEALGAQLITIGGTAPNVVKDTLGPEIRVFVNDSIQSIKKINTRTATLIVKLRDESGINVSGNNLGQDLSLQVNEDQLHILNRAYTALDNGYRNGIVIVKVENLVEGPNQLTVQAWDNVGNGNHHTIEIIVEGSLTASITHHVVYPNPSSTNSTFKFTHNRPGENLIVQLRVFSLAGSEIYSSSRRYANAQTEIGDFVWNYFDHKTKFPVKGTYIYQLELISESDGTFDQKSGKLIIQ
ncbi:type IX secretion system sortase PorU [Pararhodonellum marinum]|uniref:type IX secretion system sortase PorU n=1 Tax=Pararhodonellum marinum TaxID=2755358 RepID=UPI0018900331|nr:type IX secretion system sortase PorU [Pararhodonellum marinum]